MELVDSSEGRQGPGSNEGHARDHIPEAGQDPVQLSQGRPTKANTTTYRNERHAIQDLRDALNAHRSEISKLQPGEQFGRTFKLGKVRQGYNSKNGGTPTPVSWDSITFRVARLADGSLHLMHFSPKM